MVRCAVIAAVVLLGSSAGAADLNLRMQTAGDRLIITNNGPSASGCTVLVNSKFRREEVRLPRGEPVTIMAASLISGGLRFSPGVDPLDRIHVLCSEPEAADSLYKP